MCVWVSIFIYIEWFEKLILLKNKIFLKYNFIVFDLLRWDVLLYLLREFDGIFINYIV